MHAPPIQRSATGQMTARHPGSSSVVPNMAAAGTPQRPASEGPLPAQSLLAGRGPHPSSPMSSRSAARAGGPLSSTFLLHRRAWHRTEGAKDAAIAGLRLQEGTAALALIE